MADLNVGTAFFIVLNAGLAVCGLVLVRQKERRLAGFILLGSVAAFLTASLMSTTRLSTLLFGRQLIKADLYHIFVFTRPEILADVAIAVGAFVAWRLSPQRVWAAVVLSGLFLEVAAWQIVISSEPSTSASTPVPAAAALGIVAARLITYKPWLAVVPVTLSSAMFGWLIASSGVVLEQIQYPVEAVRVPPGSRLNLFSQLSERPTSIAIDPGGSIYVATLEGTVYKLLDSDQDGKADDQILFAGGLGMPLGVALHEGTVFISTSGSPPNSGRVVRALDKDGDGKPDDLADIIMGLPVGIRVWHQNNGIVVGPDGRLYVGVGATSDHDPEKERYGASILASNQDGSDLHVFATGLRNPYGLAFSADGLLLATDNGPDELYESSSNEPSDELNLIVDGGDYGMPRSFGFAPASSGTISPIAVFQAHSVPTGLTVYTGSQFPQEYRNNAFVAVWKGRRLAWCLLTNSDRG